MKNVKKILHSIILVFTLLLCTASFSACGGVNVTAISIDGGPQFLEVGEEYTFSATLTPKKASSKDITWSSNNTAVASINEKGKVKAKSAGTAIITAMSKKNSNVKDTFELVVAGGDSGIIMLKAEHTYDGQPKPYEASYVPEGLTVRYTYYIKDVYPESGYAPTDAGNYQVFAYDTVTGRKFEKTGNLIIKQKQVSVSVGDYTKKFSEPDPTFTATVSGLVEGDTLNYTIKRIAGENVEQYSIYPEVEAHKNYYPIISEGRLTIEQLPVKLIVDNKASTYGDALQTPTYTLQTLDNYLLDESLKAQIQGIPVIEMPTGTTRLNQGSYSITADNLSSTNLNITSRQNGTYTVNKKIVTIAIGPEQFKYAGQDDPALIYAIDGTLEGDDLSGCLSRIHGETVGFYEYVINQGINTNYTIMTEAGATSYKFEVRSNDVIITFNTFAIDYSQTNKEGFIPADCYTYTITINAIQKDYEVDALGNIYLDGADSVTLSHEITKEAHMTDDEKASYYQKWKVVPSKLATSGYTDPAKYTFTFVEGYKYLNLLDLNIYASETYKIYGDVDPALTYSAVGFLEGDDAESVLKTVELKREMGENVNDNGYAITLKDDIELFDTKTYYKPIFNPGVFVIEKRELRVTPISYTEENPIYYGEAPRVLEIDTTNLNIASRDNITSVLTGELSRANNEDVGQYPILGTDLQLLSDNYYITYTPGVYTIIPRPLHITAIDMSIQYGESVSRYQYSYSIIDEFTYIDEEGEEAVDLRFYTVDDPSFTGSLALTSYGLLLANHTYTIGQGNLTAGGNFDITFAQGTLTVVPREVTLAFTAQSYGFTEYDAMEAEGNAAVIDALVYNFKPDLAYNDTCNITYCGRAIDRDTNIVTLAKDSEENYVLELEFLAADGTILDDCYNVTINDNFVELFYLGQSLLDVSINNKAGGQILEKTYGDSYNIIDVFTIVTENSEYTLEFTSASFNIKGITDQAHKTTPASYLFPAGSYTVTVFNEDVVIRNKAGEDVSKSFALNIKNYGSLVVNKATLTMVEAPVVGRYVEDPDDPDNPDFVQNIVYGTARPTFVGGKYTFVNGNGATTTIDGTDEEYSTSSTATYAVQSTAHLIMATFTPNNKNFNPVTVNNISLVVTKKMIDTTTLVWGYGASVENYGVASGSIYTTHTNIEGVENIVYNGAYTEENTYNIPTTLSNYRFLRQTLGSQYKYFGVAFHDEEDGDTGFMYYIEGGTVKKVFPADSTKFYAVLDKSKTETDVKFYYSDGSKEYLLTNSSEYGTGQPVYWNSVYSPNTSGVYLARVIISSLNSNYAVFEDGDPATTEETITYYNTFLVEKIKVKVYNFTNAITYSDELAFYYVTDPEEIYGITSTFWDRNAASTNYTARATDPVDVGYYAVTFLIDQANYYYYQEHCDFEIVPIEILVVWDEVSTFDYISSDTPLTRNYKVYEGEEDEENLAYDSSDNTSVAPEWLNIIYSGQMKNGTDYYSEGKIDEVDIPCNAGTYTIAISIATGSENYTGSSSNTYEIAPIFYRGSIGITRGTITYDIAYNNGTEGAVAFFEEIAEKMITNAPLGSQAWEDYYLSISYLGHVIDPTGADNTAVLALNKAGGPYKITLSIKSKDGNIKETLKTANLTVNKTNVPTMANYPSSHTEIPFTGTYVFNALTTIDKSEIFEPSPDSYDASNMTYTYEHNGDMTIYFGIIYKYYLVWTTEETTGSPTVAPITPRADRYLYMVQAQIVVGANYSEPSQYFYTGYYLVTKTNAYLSADNIEVTYTGSNIEIPGVSAKNTAEQPLAIKYENNADVLGLYVSRVIKNLDTNAPVTFIKNAGRYQVTFTLEDTENFYTEESRFTATCTIIVNKKPIDGLSSYIVAPETFVSTEIYSTFYIDSAKAKTHNADYISGSTLLIQLCVTDANDGSGQVFRLTSKSDSSIRDLAAGTYYYYVDVSTSANSRQNIINYTRSNYVQFEIIRKNVIVTINSPHENGITINYNAGSQGYDVTYLTVKTEGSNKTVTGLDKDDFIIEYKKNTEGDEAYTTTQPMVNGNYDVKITCFNDNYVSEPIYTTLTIDAPLLDISGSISYTYSFVGEVALSLTATGGERIHTVSFDGVTTKYNDAALKNELGRWFVVRDNFGVYDPDGAIPSSFALDDGRVIGDDINAGLAALSSKLYTAEELNSLPVGIHTMVVIYISNDMNFATTFKEISFTVNAYEITSAAIVESKTDGINYDAVNKKFTHTENYNAVSQYQSGVWSYTNHTLNESFTFDVAFLIKSPSADNYDAATTLILQLSASVTGSITGAEIKTAFADQNATATSAIEKTGTLTFASSNYTLTGNDVTFILGAVFNKQTTTAFTEKRSQGNELTPAEYTYGAVFLDTYWANLNDEGDTMLDGYPSDIVSNSNHIYLYNVLNLPGGQDIDSFTSAWTFDNKKWHTFYTIKAYTYTDNVKGSQVTSDKLFNEDDNERNAAGSTVYNYYKYDLNKYTDAGLYLLEITINNSDYFLATTFNALVRIKPTTYYAKTSLGSDDGLIDTNTVTEETIKVYTREFHSTDNPSEEVHAEYTISYYRVNGATQTLDYKSKYTWKSGGGTYAAQAGGTYNSFTALLNSISGATQFKITVTPSSAYVNSMYVEDIYVLIVRGSIDIGIFNIYDEINLVDLAETHEVLGTLYEMSDGTDEGLTWSSDLVRVLEKSGNSITEESIAFMHLYDQERGVDITPGADSSLDINIMPNTNNQITINALPLIIRMDDGSQLSVMTSFVINLKIVTEIDTFNFEYNTTAQAPNVTAYFQGWSVHVPVVDNTPDINNLVLTEVLPATPFTGVTPSIKYINQVTGAESTTAPINAGNYAVQTTYTVTFNGDTTPVVFVCKNNFTISKIEAVITMESAEYLYDGYNHSLTASTAIPGLTATITYRTSSATSITNPNAADVYYAVATITDANYFGTAVATLSIKATSTRIEITMPTDLVYTGNNIAPTFRIFNENNVDITSAVGSNAKVTYNGIPSVPINAGAYEYKVSITKTTNFLANELKANYVIEKAVPTITITAPANTTYTGSTIVPTFNIPSVLRDVTTITYNGSTTEPRNAGIYEVYVNCAPNADSNFLPTTQSYTYRIYPRELTVTYDTTGTLLMTYAESMAITSLRPSPNDSSATYKYQGFEYNADGTISNTLIESDTFPQNAGVYTIIASPGSANYTGRVSTTLVIARAIPSITFNTSGVMTYNGSPKSPTVTKSVADLTYTTRYTGTNNNGVAYDSADAPTDAGNYVITVSFAGNKNYCAVESFQSFEITKLSTITLSFDNLSLSQMYTGSGLAPTAKAYLNSTEKSDLNSSIVMTFGEDKTLPIDAGTYTVKAMLVHCNYSAEIIANTFTITKSNDYTVTLTNSGQLELGATSIGTVEIGSSYMFHYVGKSYLANGELPTVNNYDSFVIPSNAGVYVATLISDNYLPTEYSFTINKKDLTSDLVLVNYDTVVGVIPDLTSTVECDGDIYKVKYLFLHENATEYTETRPTMIGAHKIKMIVCDANAQGEIEANYNITSVETGDVKVVTDSLYYMYTGNAIVVNASLYVGGILQTGTINKTFTLNGSTVSHVTEMGVYTVSLTTSTGSQTGSTTFTVIPAISLSTPANGEVYTGSAKSVSWQYVSSTDQSVYGGDTDLVIVRNGFTVSEVKDAGTYQVSVRYKGYAVLTRDFVIGKKVVTDLDTYATDVIMAYGEMNKIPTHIGSYKVKYMISLNGTNAYQEITPTVGNHLIKFIIDEDNYQGEIIRNLSVSKRALIIDVDDFEVEYTGNTIVMPSTLASFEYVTYSHSPTPSNYVNGLPRNAGTYYVQAMSSSPNYAVTYKDPSRPYIIVTITKATPTYVVTNTTQIYDGNVKVPNATAIFNGVTYTTSISNSNMIDANTYTIYFTIATDPDNFNRSADFEFTIEKAQVDITYNIPENMVYDGTQKPITASPSVADVGSVQITITKDGATKVPTEAGTYVATFTTAATTNYAACTKVVVFEILPAKTQVECAVSSYSYTGTAKTVTVTTSPTNSTKTITYTGEDTTGAAYNSTTAPTNAGTYTAHIIVVPADSNYSREEFDFTYTIVKVIDTITYSGAADGYFYYDGTAKNLTSVSSGSGTHTVTYKKLVNSSPTTVNASEVKDEGSYRAIITTTGDKNHYGTTKVVYFAIYKQRLAANITGKSVDYTGTPQSIVPDNTHSGLVKVWYSGKMYKADGKCTEAYAETDVAPTRAGIYTAVLKPTSDNYAIDGTSTAALIIKRTQLDISIDIDGVSAATTIIDYTGSEYAVTANAMIGGTKTDVSTISANALTIRISGTTTPVPLKEGGLYELIVDLNDKNFIGHNERLITIRPQSASIFATQTVASYTGQKVSIGYTIVSKSGVDITTEIQDKVQIVYTQGGTVVDPINTGTYTANIILANTSYVANATYTFTIVETLPDLIYRGGASPVYFNTTDSTGVTSFNTAQFEVSLAGVKLNAAEYSVSYKILTNNIDEETGEVTTSWENATVTAGSVLNESGKSYQIIITISNTTKYQSNLIGSDVVDAEGNVTQSDVLTWSYLFYIASEE